MTYTTFWRMACVESKPEGTNMPIMTQAELEPLQQVRRTAEEYTDAIRQIALARRAALPPIRRMFDAPAGAIEEHDRFAKLEDIVGALQTIYDAVSELEFEEEQPEEPAEPEPPEEPEDEDAEDDEEDEDEDSDEDEES